MVRPQGAYSSCQSLLTGCYLSLNDGEGTGELQSFSYDKRKRLIGSSIYNAVSRATTYTFTEYNELNAPVLINRRFVSPDGTCLSDMSYHYDNGGRETASALTVSLSDGRTNKAGLSLPVSLPMTNSAVRFSSRSLLANGSPRSIVPTVNWAVWKAPVFRRHCIIRMCLLVFGTSILTGASLRFLFGSWTIVTACFCLMETGNPCAIWLCILMTVPVIYVSKRVWAMTLWEIFVL